MARRQPAGALYAPGRVGRDSNAGLAELVHRSMVTQLVGEEKKMDVSERKTDNHSSGAWVVAQAAAESRRQTASTGTVEPVHRATPQGSPDSPLIWAAQAGATLQMQTDLPARAPVTYIATHREQNGRPIAVADSQELSPLDRTND